MWEELRRWEQPPVEVVVSQVPACTSLLVIRTWSVSHSTPQTTWGGPRDWALPCLHVCFIRNVEKLGRVMPCWGLLGGCWFCPAMEAVRLPLPWFFHYPNARYCHWDCNMAMLTLFLHKLNKWDSKDSLGSKRGITGFLADFLIAAIKLWGDALQDYSVKLCQQKNLDFVQN